MPVIALFLVLVLSTLAIGAGSVAGQPAMAEPAHGGGFIFPDTTAGRAFERWLAAYNAADIDALRGFHREYSPPDQVEGRTAFDLLSRMQTGGIDPTAVVRSEEYQLVLTGRTRLTELWMEGLIRLSPEPRHRVQGIGGRPVPPPAGASPAPLSDDELRAELDRYIEKLAEAGVFSGTVLIARDGEPLYSSSVGMADAEAGIANELNTTFNLGSMNKMFTAIAIAQLMEQGRLALDQPIGAYLDGLPAEVAETVMVRHLLSHTSGLGDYFGPEFERVKETLRSPRDYLPLFIDRPLRFAPGTEWAYSNGGFILLGAIVEAVSGMDYFDYIREYVYRPAGMADSGSFEKDAAVPNRARGYTHPLPRDPAELRAEDALAPRVDNHALLPRMGSSAGGGYSTVIDLLRFAEALRSGVLVSRETADLFMTGTVSLPFDEDERYAFGFQDERYRGTRIAGHGGGFPGVSSKLDIYRDLGYTVVVLSNIDDGAQPVVAKVRDLLVRG